MAQEKSILPRPFEPKNALGLGSADGRVNAVPVVRPVAQVMQNAVADAVGTSRGLDTGGAPCNRNLVALGWRPRESGSRKGRAAKRVARLDDMLHRIVRAGKPSFDEPLHKAVVTTLDLFRVPDISIGINSPN